MKVHTDRSKTAQDKTSSRPKLSDAERHKRFVETAEKIGASNDSGDFDVAFDRVTATPLAHRSRRNEKPASS
jgi:hypothetical protein